MYYEAHPGGRHRGSDLRHGASPFLLEERLAIGEHQVPKEGFNSAHSGSNVIHLPLHTCINKLVTYMKCYHPNQFVGYIYAIHISNICVRLQYII